MILNRVLLAAGLPGFFPRSTSACLAACGLALFGLTLSALAVSPYAGDANTVLLEHFDGATGGAAYTVFNAGGPCGVPYPVAATAPVYQASQPGMASALRMSHPTAAPEPAYSYLTFPGGELLSRANGTLEFWVFLAGYGPSGIGLVSQGPYFGACSGWTFSMSVSAAGILQASAWNSFDLNSGTTAVPLNRWAHLAVSWGGSGAKLYLNGQVVGTHAATNGPAAGFGGQFLGTFGSNPVDGLVLVDELRISDIQRTSFEATPEPVDGFWRTGAPMPYLHYDAAIGTFNGQLHLLEGLGSSFSNTQSYSPLIYQWSPRLPAAASRSGGAAASLGAIIYVAGGTDHGTNATADTLTAYNLGDSTTTAKRAMPTARTRAAAAAAGNRLFVAGGNSAGVPVATLEAYDPPTDSWSAKAPMPTAREAAAAAAIGGRIYVVGGVNGTGVSNALECYDPATDSWTSLRPMPTARRQAVVGAINGKLHVAGGMTESGPTRVLEVYDPATGLWHSRAAKPVSSTRLANGQAAVGSLLCVPGGIEGNPTEVYHPHLAGPVYPPPGGASYGESGAAGRGGGVTWSFNPVPLRNETFVWWGAVNDGVRLSFNNSGFVNPGEIMTYDPALSNLAGGSVVWTGQTSMPGGSVVHTRCTLSLVTNGSAPSLSAATGLDLQPNIGGLFAVWVSTAYQANIRFEASSSPGGPFVPALDFYDSTPYKPAGGGTAFTSFRAGFYYVNQVPIISSIANRTVQGSTAVGPLPFVVADLETAASALTVSARSGNPALLPDENIALGGSGNGREVTLTPAPGQTGETLVTLTVGNGAESADTSFFVRFNSPPRLTANNTLAVDAGAAAVIGSDSLAAADNESAPAQLVYTVNPDGQGGPPREGSLLLDGVPLASGGTFTQADVDAGRLAYSNTNRCAATDDFQFNVTDADGGITPSGEHTAYSFRVTINPVHLPFTVADLETDVGLGGTTAGRLTANNPNCPPLSMAYRLLSPPAKGSAIVNPDGTFTYAATPGETGDDQFQFQANDGVSDATAPGTVLVHIVRLPPLAVDSQATTLQGTALEGQLAASQPNNPPFPMTYSITSQGTKGTVAITDAATGAFTYRPAAGAFGTDTFTFHASDGVLTSPTPGTVTVVIRPGLDPNDILVADTVAKALILVRPPAGGQFALASGGLLQSPRAVAVESTGQVLVLDSAGGLVRVDPRTGAQSQLCAAAAFSSGPIGPTAIAVEPSRQILVADGTNGLVRVDPDSGAVTPFASGGSLGLCQGVAVAGDGSIFAAVPAAMTGGTSALVRVDPATAAQNVLAAGPPLVLPIGLAAGNDGKLYLSDIAAMAGAPPDKLLAVDMAGDTPAAISADALLQMPSGLGRSVNNTLFVACAKSASILEATTAGTLAVVSSGNLLQEPFGLAVVRQTPRLTGIERLPDGQLRLGIAGEPGHWVVVEATTDLLQWTPLAVLPNPAGMLTFDDSAAPSMPWRFYRLRRY